MTTVKSRPRGNFLMPWICKSLCVSGHEDCFSKCNDRVNQLFLKPAQKGFNAPYPNCWSQHFAGKLLAKTNFKMSAMFRTKSYTYLVSAKPITERKQLCLSLWFEKSWIFLGGCLAGSLQIKSNKITFSAKSSAWKQENLVLPKLV